MRIAMRVTVDIDGDAWATEYGLDKSDVRADVKRWVEAALWDGTSVRPEKVEVK